MVSDIDVFFLKCISRKQKVNKTDERVIRELIKRNRIGAKVVNGIVLKRGYPIITLQRFCKYVLQGIKKK